MEEFRRLLEALHGQGVEMIIVGGLAAVLHGASFVTEDLDVCYRRTGSNYRALVRALKPFNPLLRLAKGEAIPFPFDEKIFKNTLNFTLETSAGDIDLLGELEFVGRFEDLEPSAGKTTLYGLPFKIISLDHLIKIKKKLRRNKDIVHLDILTALQRELQKG